MRLRCGPAGSEIMKPVGKNPPMSRQRGGREKVPRQVEDAPFSSDSGTSTMASTPEMQEEMRKLIDAAKAAVADLQAAARPESADGYERQQRPPA